jgi:hypothetical protein
MNTRNHREITSGEISAGIYFIPGTVKNTFKYSIGLISSISSIGSIS